MQKSIFADSSGNVSALIEPLQDNTDEAVVAKLEEAGVQDVKILAPWWISARGPIEVLKQVGDIAEVHIKPTKSFR